MTGIFWKNPDTPPKTLKVDTYENGWPMDFIEFPVVEPMSMSFWKNDIPDLPSFKREQYQLKVTTEHRNLLGGSFFYLRFKGAEMGFLIVDLLMMDQDLEVRKSAYLESPRWKY